MIALQDRFAGKVAVVTGAALGIGLASAERLLQEGAKLVGCDPRPIADLAAGFVASLLVDDAWAVSGDPDMRPFRGPIGWTRRTEA